MESEHFDLNSNNMGTSSARSISFESVPHSYLQAEVGGMTPCQIRIKKSDTWGKPHRDVMTPFRSCGTFALDLE